MYVPCVRVRAHACESERYVFSVNTRTARCCFWYPVLSEPTISSVSMIDEGLTRHDHANFVFFFFFNIDDSFNENALGSSGTIFMNGVISVSSITAHALIN